MDKVSCKLQFTKCQLLVIMDITVCMFLPPAFACEIGSVTLYAGVDETDAEDAERETFYIGKKGGVYFHAVCADVDNPDELDIQWEFDFNNGGTATDYSDTTSYDSESEYLKKTSSSTSYDIAGTKSPSVTCYLIDSDGNQVGSSASDTCTVYVVSVDIEMQSLAEEEDSSGNPVTPPHEEEPGAFLGLNDNDSDADGKPDNDPTDTVIAGGDLDLKAATLSITPSWVSVGNMLLTPDSGTIIKVYENQDKSGGQQYSWATSSTPDTVYVEGFDMGTDDLKLTWEYDNDGDNDDDKLCDDQVKVTVVRADLDVDNNTDIGDADDGVENYLPGYEGTSTILSTGSTFEAPVYEGQDMTIVLKGVGANSGVDEVVFEILEPSDLAGFCENASDSMIEGAEKDNDYSFYKDRDTDTPGSPNVMTITPSSTATADDGGKMETDRTWVRFWCKDYGGRCKVRVGIKIGSTMHYVLAPLVIPLDDDPAPGGPDGIADVYEKLQLVEWKDQYGLGSGFDLNDLTFFGQFSDSEEQDADGTNNGDGGRNLPVHAAQGDGLSVFKEYRGYIFTGGASSFAGGHKRLNAARKELLVEISEMSDIASASNNNANAAAQTYTLTSTMTTVSDLYND